MVLPIALVCSTHPPVSVCGTGSSRLPRGFSRKHGLTGFAQSLRPPPQPSWEPRFTSSRPTWPRGDVQNPVRLPFSVAPSVMAPLRRCRNVYLLCIGYAFRPRLSSRLTLGGLALPRKPWVYGGGPPRLAPRLRPARKAPLPLKKSVRRFGTMLSPVYCRRMSTRPVSYYALFKWMAASKPTSWLSGQTHILCHSAWIWGP